MTRKGKPSRISWLQSGHFNHYSMVVQPDPFRGMGMRRTPRRPTVEPHSQGLDQRSKMARRRSSDAGQSRRRWVRSCRWCALSLQYSPSVLSCI